MKSKSEIRKSLEKMGEDQIIYATDIPVGLISRLNKKSGFKAYAMRTFKCGIVKIMRYSKAAQQVEMFHEAS